MRLALLLALMLIFGCVGEEQLPPEENKTLPPQTNNTSIKIIIEEQKNQTTLKNITKENVTIENNTKTGIEYEFKPNQQFGVYFIDVGGPGLQGDAILLKKGDFDMLLDAGPAEKSGKVIDFLRSRAVDDIEVLVSTNADPRHYGGISAVSDAFKVEEFWWNGASTDDADYSALIKKMENRTIMRVVEEGYAADFNGINFSILNPPSKRFKDVNNDAIVLKVIDRNFSLLLTSGIQTGAQGRLLSDFPILGTEIIEAPYYGVGAGTANIGIFLVTYKPKVMIISGSSDESAANGGSREPFIRLMKQYNISYYENYRNGTIRISGDGQNYSIMALGKGQ